MRSAIASTVASSSGAKAPTREEENQMLPSGREAGSRQVIRDRQSRARIRLSSR